MDNTIPERPRGALAAWPEPDVRAVLELLMTRRPDGRAAYSYRKIEAMTGVPFSTVRNWNLAMRQGRLAPPSPK